MDRDFPSKRDAWLVIVVSIGSAMLVAGAIVMLASPGPIAARLALVVRCPALVLAGDRLLARLS